MDVDGLRLIPNLDVKLLDVAGFDRARDLVPVLQGDDIGDEPAAGQQAEMPEDEQQDSSHNHIRDCGFTLNAQRAFGTGPVKLGLPSRVRGVPGVGKFNRRADAPVERSANRTKGH